MLRQIVCLLGIKDNIVNNTDSFVISDNYNPNSLCESVVEGVLIYYSLDCDTRYEKRRVW